MKLLKQQQEAKHLLSKYKVGALFMEAGTGKTRTAIELINSVDNIDLVIWLGPKRTLTREKDGVITEVEKWGLNSPVSYYGIESIGMSDRIYLEARNELKTAKNAFLVIDESIKIKNIDAKRTKRALELSTLVSYKLILNGTPLSKNLFDIYPQMEFLDSRILNMSLSQFKNTFVKYTTITNYHNGRGYKQEFINGYANIDYLYSLIGRYVYECELNLDIDTNHHNIRYEIDPFEKKEYYRLKEKYLDDDTLKILNNNIFLEMTQKMQHTYCCTSDKIEKVRKLLETIPKEKTIIFCKFVDSVALCEKEFKDIKVLSLQKSSLGLNLQDYYHTIYFDKTFDYGLLMQSSRRTYRTGQTNNCQYYNLTGDVGLEEMFDRNISKKGDLVQYFRMAGKSELRKLL